MDDIDNLAAACLASPADDLPRRILADRLEEDRKPAEARLIRLFCESGPDEPTPGRTWMPDLHATDLMTRRLAIRGTHLGRLAALAGCRRVLRRYPVPSAVIEWPDRADVARFDRAVAIADCHLFLASVGQGGSLGEPASAWGRLRESIAAAEYRAEEAVRLARRARAGRARRAAIRAGRAVRAARYVFGSLARLAGDVGQFHMACVAAVNAAELSASVASGGDPVQAIDAYVHAQVIVRHAAKRFVTATTPVMNRG